MSDNIINYGSIIVKIEGEYTTISDIIDSIITDQLEVAKSIKDLGKYYKLYNNRSYYYTYIYNNLQVVMFLSIREDKSGK